MFYTYGDSTTGLIGFEVKELVDNSMVKLYGNSHSTGYFYYTTKPKLKDKTRLDNYLYNVDWFGVYEDMATNTIFCENALGMNCIIKLENVIVY